MAESYEKINYSLRPAKAIERRILGELFTRLNVFSPVERYRYVGFGSIYFSDFILFHRMFGFKNMISIENEGHNKKRFKLNSPFRFVKILFGEAIAILQTLKWGRKNIVWLDFDDPLDLDMLLCIEYLSKNLTSGSLLIISCNGSLKERASDFAGKEKILRSQLEGKITTEITKPNQIEGWTLSKLYRSVIDSEIKTALVNRNEGLSEGNRFNYQQLINIHYQENSRSARMLTVGGVIYNTNDLSKYKSCSFQQLPFYSDNEVPYKIEVPNLTYKELKYLDTKIPILSNSLNNHDIPQSDIDLYQRYYRYFPNYKDVEA